MRLHYPVSFLKLLLAGFALVALPLALALLGAFFSLDRLGQQSAIAINRATTITRDSRALREHLTALERLARQQLVLNDQTGLDAYRRRRQDLLDTIAHLSPHSNSLAIRADLTNLQRTEAKVWQLLQLGELPVTSQKIIITSFAEMGETTARIVDHADASIEGDITKLYADSASARRQLLLQLWALLPVGLLLIGGTLLLIRRPVRQLEVAIRGLGEGRFDKPIDVDGPRDFVALGQRLDWLRQRLRELDEQKTRLLHHVSHELKTPLTALQEGSALLADRVAGPLNTEQSEIVSILRSNCQRLRKLIENLLDYSSIRFQPSTLRLEPLDLSKTILQVLEDQKLALTARNISVTQALLPLHIQADREKLRVALDNLLSNAIKYTPENSTITVRCQTERNRAVVEICDQGTGVPAEIAPRMFEPFVQGPAPAGSPVKGSGLGLSIVREYIGAHGGDVALLPNHPCGTCARIQLPLSMPQSS
ncbi:sensor histidine kinase [Uliginosibacterium gangwonense]|uniref:sensor histidine kinase n=1 Tax=Uliginosibacterium gangwonense TaxID=392736 RepID=UPI00037A191E|nr:HAMP domain-containing sensor histidine kinase [Uliginosibacterium gangwonense]